MIIKQSSNAHCASNDSLFHCFRRVSPSNYGKVGRGRGGGRDDSVISPARYNYCFASFSAPTTGERALESLGRPFSNERSQVHF